MFASKANQPTSLHQISPTSPSQPASAAVPCACDGTPTSTPVALSTLALGQVALIDTHSLDQEDAQLLTAMGVIQNATIKVCRTGSPCIIALVTKGADGMCNCASSRIGLTRTLASKVMVRPNAK
jgi:Fe2+ transport system protein FeoA